MNMEKTYQVRTAAGLCAVREVNGAVVSITFEESQNPLVYNDFPVRQLHLVGTPFQIRVWEELLRLSAGECITYGQLAHRIGKPRAVRAVASAVARNKIAVLVPCHRIVPATGGVGKYRWGTERKRLLLESERRI